MSLLIGETIQSKQSNHDLAIWGISTCDRNLWRQFEYVNGCCGDGVVYADWPDPKDHHPSG